MTSDIWESDDRVSMSRPDADPDCEGVPHTQGLPAREFTAQFQASTRTLWLIAVGIVRDGALAEDVVQEAAMIALGKLDQFRPDSNFTAWTGQIVRNVALNRARKERKRRTSSLDASAVDESAARRPHSDGAEIRVGPRGQLPIDQGHFDDRVVEALNGLSETARTCLLLRTLEGMEYSRIALLMGMPEGTAMSHVHRARAYLRERLSGEGTDSAKGREALP